MKKLVLIFCIIHCSTNLSNPEIAPIQNEAPIVIDLRILSIVDGHPSLVRTMPAFESLSRKINAILTRKMPTKHMPDCTFQLIVARENGLSPKELLVILNKFIGQFSRIPEMKTFYTLNLSHDIIRSIIDRWQEQRNRPDTLLFIIATEEYKKNPEKTLAQHITTLSKFKTFLEDLGQFSADLVCSFPKSLHLYQELKKNSEHHESTV